MTTIAMATATTCAMVTAMRWRVKKRAMARGARAMTMVTKRAMAMAARAMAMATKRAIATDGEGNGNDGKNDGNSNE
jgi:hypothetical protein